MSRTVENEESSVSQLWTAVTCILFAASLFCRDVSHWSGGSCRPESPRQN